MDLIVIGAGLSGLTVAHERAALGDTVTVLEARDRVGGRLWTQRGVFAEGQFGELGAETVYAGHGTVLRLIGSLGLEVARCGYFDPESPPLFFGGRWLNDAERRVITGWLIGSYRTHPPEPFENLDAWTSRLRAPTHVRRFLHSFAQYTPVTSLRHADASEFARQLEHGGDSFRIVGGNDLVTQRLAEGLDVRLGEHVRVVEWSGSRVRVETDTASIDADRAVVTVPGPLTTSIGFSPALPPDKAAALAELTYGTATKVVVQYRERYSVGAAVGPGCFTDGIPPWLVDQSIHQRGDAVCVSTLLGGDDEPHAVDATVLAAFDATVAGMAGGAATRLGAISHSWTRDPLSRAIVRAPLGDQRTRLLPIVQRPLGGLVHFAGEHTDDRVGPGGLEGACRSAYRVLGELDR